MQGAIPSSRNELEPPTLRFGSHQDALDYARHAVEDANSRLAAQSLNAVDRYRKGDIGIYIGLRSRKNGHQCDLVFSRVPADTKLAGTSNVSGQFSGSDSTAKERRRICDDKRLQGEVFVGVSDLVNGPEGVIPSFVSLEALKERTDFRGQILAATGQVVPPFLFRGTEGKFGGLRGGAFAGDSGSVSGLIEDSSQIVSSIEQDAGQHLRHLLCEFDFMKVLAGIGILINEAGPWLVCDEFVNGCFEIANVMLCAHER